MVAKDNRKEEDGEGAVEKERKVENALFFPLSLVHMRAQLCLHVSHFQFALSNGNKTFECVKYVYCVYRVFLNLSIIIGVPCS